MNDPKIQGDVPPHWKRRDFSAEEYAQWNSFKLKYSVGTEFVSKISSVDTYGCYVEVEEPFVALLLVVNFKKIGPLKFPKDYPRIDEEIKVRVVQHSDSITNVIGKMTLEQV